MADPEKPSNRPAAIKKWRADISAACKREERYRQVGKRLWKMYEGEQPDEVPFNILFSNTEILLPALYGQPPRPVVQRRFKDEDPLGKAAAEAATRMLMFLRDTNSDEYDDFDTTMKENVLDACVPGRGLMEFCYEGKTAEVPVPGQQKPSVQLVSECVYPETCLWNRYVFGFAKKWKDVPWVAFELYFEKDEAEKEFSKAVSDKLRYVTEGDQDSESKDSAAREGDRKVAKIWKIWDKKTRQLLFVADSGYDEDYLKTEDDPYELTGFFPIPKPLRLIAKSGNLVPTAPYTEYENQAKELNTLTLRINSLIKQMKIRGVYDPSITAIEDALKGEDGDLTPAGEATTLTREGGLDKAIWLMPIDKQITVVQQLYLARQNCKQTIYEIMGLADIMRGSTQASETLGAQQLKAQFGSVRMKNPQHEVQRYARDCFRIMLEIAATKFMPETWAKATGLPYLTDEQAVMAQQQIQMAAQQYSVMVSQAQAQGQPAPPPPQPPQLPPKWSDVLGVLKSDLSREYKVDIETNSTIDPDASEAKKNMVELMQAMSQFLTGVGPLVQEGVLPIEAAKAMMLGVARQFEMGSEVEDYIKMMQPPQPQQQDKSGEMAAQAQLQKSELEKQGLGQQLELEKKSNALNAREADLKVREAKVAASEELHRIQMTAAKTSMAGEHKTHLAQTKQVSDAGVAKIQQIAKEIDLRIKADAQSRTTEKAANEKVQAEKEKSAAKGATLEALVKELTVAVQAMTKATLTPKERKLVKDPKTGKTAGMIESPMKE